MSWLSGGRSMLLRSLKGGEWSQFLDYLSPSFLDVMPISGLLSQGRELTSNAVGGRRFDEIVAQTAAQLRDLGIGVRLTTAPAGKGPPPVAELTPDARRGLGHAALEIYFAQLFRSHTAILDLRSSRFAVAAGDEPVWFPRPLYLRWDESFLAGLRELYRGFYSQDRPRFDAALQLLELGPAGDVLLGHFGGDDQRKVRFTSSVFHSTFHTAFVRCREAGVVLHRNFLALGIYLACLYDLLEVLDLEFDVRGAFERAST